MGLFHGIAGGHNALIFQDGLLLGESSIFSTILALFIGVDGKAFFARFTARHSVQRDLYAALSSLIDVDFGSWSFTRSRYACMRRTSFFFCSIDFLFWLKAFIPSAFFFFFFFSTAVSCLLLKFLRLMYLAD